MLHGTHKNGGFLAATAGYTALVVLNKVPYSGVSAITHLCLIVPAASWGSAFLDLDHCWSSIRDHTPINYVFHKTITRFSDAHRSMATHWLGYIPLFMFCVYALLRQPLGLPFLSAGDNVIWQFLLMGFSVGYLSHLFLDLLTTDGLPFCRVRKKNGTYKVYRFSLVGGSSKFSTSTEWEPKVNRAIWQLTKVLLLFNIGWFFREPLIYLLSYLEEPVSNAWDYLKLALSKR